MTNNSTPASISDVKIRIVESGSGGLVAWASCVISGAIKLDNIAIRRGNDGSLYLTYPNKLGANGSKHSYFNPISVDASNAIERAVFTRLSTLARLTASTHSKSDHAS